MKTCNPSGTTTLSSPEKLLLQNAFGSSELPVPNAGAFFSNIFFLHVKIAMEKIMLDIPYKKTGAQNAYISYEKLESRLKAIPQEFFADVLNFFDLLEYKIDVVKSEKKKEKNARFKKAWTCWRKSRAAFLSQFLWKTQKQNTSRKNRILIT